MKAPPRFTEAVRNSYREINAGPGAKCGMPASRHKRGRAHWFPHVVRLPRTLGFCRPHFHWLRDTPGLTGWYRLEKIENNPREETEVVLPNGSSFIHLGPSFTYYVCFTDAQTAFAFKMRWL